MNNKFGLVGGSISSEISHQCFTDEQREILEYQQGKLKITIADQLNRFYGHKYLVWSESKTLNIAAQIVHENEHLIEEIKTLKEKIKILKDPGNYKRVVTTKTSSLGCANSQTNTDNLNKQIDISEIYSQNNSVSYQRSMTSEPTELINKLDVLDDTNKLLTLKQNKSKGKFTEDEMTETSLLKINREEINEQELVPASDNRDYHNSAFAKTGGLSFSNSDSMIEHRALNKNTSVNKGVSTATNKGTTEENIESESVYKSLIIEIPRLRVKFWNKFWFLFKDCDSCW